MSLKCRTTKNLRRGRFYKRMEPTSLRKRLSLLKGLHLAFILSLLVSGIAGACLFGVIVRQRIRTCPAIYPIYITFWLCLGLSVLQLVLALSFLCWFLVSVCSPRGRESGSQSSKLSSTAPECPTPRTVLEAIGRPSVGCSSTNSTGDVEPASCRAITESLRQLRTVSQPRRPRVGWLCMGGIFLAIVCAGLILSLVLTQSHINYYYSRFTDDLISVFVEARVNFQSTAQKSLFKPNNAFVCWTQAQEDFGCCGLDRYTDWLNQTIIQNPQLPDTCYCYSSCMSRPANHVTQISGRPVYALGCKRFLQDTLLFELLATRIYLAVVLSILITTFLFDLVFTVFTAHVTLIQSQSGSQSQPHRRPVLGNVRSRCPRPTSATNHSTRSQF